MPIPPEILQQIMQQASAQSPVENVGDFAIRPSGSGYQVINTRTGQVHWSGSSSSAASQVASSLNANPSLIRR